MTKISEEQKAIFLGLLRKARLKATPGRLAILGLLKETRRPLSPQGIIEKMGDLKDQATVYRNLASFKNAGIIRQIDLRHNHPHYELIEEDDHHHIICTNCGYVKEIPGCDMDMFKQTILKSDTVFKEITDHTLEFYGVCKKCDA